MELRRLLLAPLTGALIIAAVAYPGQPVRAGDSATSRPLGEGVRSATIHRDDGKGQPGEPLTRALPSDRTLHFRVEMDRRRDEPVVARWVFISVDTSVGKNVRFGESTLRGKGYSKISGTLRGAADWPEGQYHVDLFLNDKLAQGIDYVVGPAQPSAPPSSSSTAPTTR